MKIGDIVNILDTTTPNKKYLKCEIIQILDKKYYNMYLCENIKTKQKVTFTDMDMNLHYNHKGKIIEVVK